MTTSQFNTEQEKSQLPKPILTKFYEAIKAPLAHKSEHCPQCFSPSGQRDAYVRQ